MLIFSSADILQHLDVNYKTGAWVIQYVIQYKRMNVSVLRVSETIEWCTWETCIKFYYFSRHYYIQIIYFILFLIHVFFTNLCFLKMFDFVKNLIFHQMRFLSEILSISFYCRLRDWRNLFLNNIWIYSSHILLYNIIFNSYNRWVLLIRVNSISFINLYILNL